VKIRRCLPELWQRIQEYSFFRGHGVGITPANIHTNLRLLETRVIDLHYAADSLCLSSFRFFRWAPQDFSISIYFYKRGVLAVQRQSKVIDVCANRKRVCDFLLVRNSNLGPILHHFGATARFMCSWPHPYSTLILGVFPVHQIPALGSASAWALSYLAVKLFSKNSNLCDHGT